MPSESSVTTRTPNNAISDNTVTTVPAVASDTVDSGLKTTAASGGYVNGRKLPIWVAGIDPYRVGPCRNTEPPRR